MKFKDKLLKQNFGKAFPSMMLIFVIFAVSMATSLFLGIPLSRITADFNYSVLVILIVMELFTNLVAETGVMQFVATKLAVVSKGSRRKSLWLFGLLMFFISAFLNNITAILIILPVIFVLLKAVDADAKYITVFFSVILALSNTGGAASPIGDLPAVIIMGSGITSFTGYLFRAFPLFLITSVAIIVIWNLTVKEKAGSEDENLLAVDLLASRYRNVRIRTDVLIPLGVILFAMFVAWCVVPQDIFPPEMVALAGYCAAIVVASARDIEIRQSVDMKSVLTIASFLFLATVVNATGLLTVFAQYLQAHITNPKTLLMVIMVITSIVSGLVSAGPAAAAMLPVIVNLCNTTLAAYTHWVAIAYAASICAGSSMFMWSATAGFILSGKIEAEAMECEGKKVIWGIPQYLSYGIVNYLVQMAIAVGWIAFVI